MGIDRTIFALATLLSASAAFAQVSGTWNGQSGNWSDVTRWSSNPAYPSAGGVASFGTVGGGSVNNNFFNLSLSSLIFDGPLTNSIGGSSISFSSGNFVIDSRNAELFYNSNYATPSIHTLVRAGSFTKSGDGALMLNGAVTVSGAFTINAGTLQYLFDDSWFKNVGSITLNGGTLMSGDGASAVTLSKPLNFATVGTLSGNCTYTGALSGAGSAVFANSIGTLTTATSYAGNTTVVGGGTTGLILNAAGRIGSASTLDINGRVLLSNLSTPNADRLNDSAPVTLRSGTLELDGNGTTSLNETVGNLTLSGGANSIVLVNNGAATQLTAGTLTRQGHATLNTTGLYANSVGTFTLTNSASILSGGGGAAGTTTMSIIPFAVDDGVNIASRLLTIDNGVVRPLDVNTEMSHSFSGATAATNLAVSNSTSTLNSTATVNSVLTSSLYTLSGTGTLTVASGLVAGPGSVTAAVDFANHEGVILESNVAGPISGSAGLTFDCGSINFAVHLNPANTYSGVTTINGGTIVLGGDVRPGVASSLGNDSSAIVLHTGLRPANLIGPYANYRDVTIDVPLATAQQFAPVLGGSITQAGNVALGGPVNLNDNAKVTGNISGAGRIYDFVNLATLSGQNTYTGGTELSFATLSLGSNAALGSGSLLMDGSSNLIAVGDRALPNVLYNSSPNSTATFSGGAMSLASANLGNATVTFAVNNASTSFGNGITNGTLLKQGAGRLRAGPIDLTELDVNAGTVELLPNSSVSRVGTFSIAAGTQLNLGNSDLIDDYASRTAPTLASIRTLITAGQLSYTSVTGKALGYADNATLKRTTFDGRNVGLTSLLFKYAYQGDCNLDGKVDIGDLGILATHWQKAGSWQDGDFDYSGKVDIGDLGELATNWQAGVANPSAMTFEQALAEVGLSDAVPEPTGGLAMMIVLIAARHRKRLTAA